MLGLPDKLALYKGTFKFSGMGFNAMGADGSGLDTFACTGISLAFMGTAVVGTDLLGAFDGEAVVVRTGVGDIGADDDIIGANMNLADASFETSAFYQG